MQYTGFLHMNFHLNIIILFTQRCFQDFKNKPSKQTHLVKKEVWPGVVLHAFNSNTWKAEVGGWLSVSSTPVRAM